MKPAALSAALLLAAVPAAALSAQSCPGPDLSVAPDGATAVEIRHADVPSARFPGAWQQGRLGDLSYRLYPGGFGTIGAGPHMEAWRIEMSCNPEDRTCTYWRFGEVPDGMQPRARQLGRCLLGPEPEAPPPAPAPGKAAPPAAPASPAAAPQPAARPAPAQPKALTREPPPAAPDAPSGPARADREAAPTPAAPRTLAREPAPATPNAPAGPTAAARETAPPEQPETLTREPAPDAPAGPARAARETTPPREPAPAAPDAAAASGAAAREPAPPAAAPGTAAREPAPASRDSAPPLAGPRPFLCWTVPEIGGTGTPAGSEVLVCRPAPVSPQVQAAPAPAAPQPAAPRPASQTPAPAQAAPESAVPQPAPAAPQPDAPRPASQSPAPAQPAAESAGPSPDPGPARSGPAPLPGAGPEDRPAAEGQGPGAARQQDGSPAAAPGNGDAAAPEGPRQPPPPAPPAPRAAGAAAAFPAAPPNGRGRINLLPLSRPVRDGDRPQAPAPWTTTITRPAAPRARGAPVPRAAQGPQPPAAVPRLALTRCALGSAAALGSEDIGDIGQISVNLACSGRFGSRLTFSGGVTAHPVGGDRHGGSPAYSYALNWRVTDRVTLTYANYAAALAGGRALAGLGEGRLQLSAPLARVPLGTPGMPDRRLTCTGFASLARSAPANAGVNCGVDVTPRLTVRFTALAYPPGAQREGDADFSYSASYALSDRVALTYSNYANNRWPWNRAPDQAEPFHGGTLGLSWRRDF